MIITGCGPVVHNRTIRLSFFLDHSRALAVAHAATGFPPAEPWKFSFASAFAPRGPRDNRHAKRAAIEDPPGVGNLGDREKWNAWVNVKYHPRRVDADGYLSSHNTRLHHNSDVRAAPPPLDLFLGSIPYFLGSCWVNINFHRSRRFVPLRKN